MKNFKVVTIAPVYSAGPSLFLAAARAGAAMIMDTEFCPDQLLNLAERNLHTFLEKVPEGGMFGMRIRFDQLEKYKDFCDLLKGYEHILLISGVFEDFKVDSRAKVIYPDWLMQGKRKLWLEITDAAHLSAIDKQPVKIQSIVARGNESGGWVGNDSAYILSQKVLAEASLPVYIQGGIGIYTAAACRAAGASGVVLDDQLVLMDESPLLKDWRRVISTISGEQTRVYLHDGVGVRVVNFPAFKSGNVINDLYQPWNMQDFGKDLKPKIDSLVGWGDPDLYAWPAGQALGMAQFYANKYRKVAKLIHAIENKSAECLVDTKALRPLKEGSPLAVAHGTRYPIVQGPMTRVSDTAEFIESVALNGGLPLLAVAMMKEPELKKLLQDTSELLKDKPWGVGVLGFISEEMMKMQFEQIMQVKPPYVLVAGGSYDHAMQFENNGIKAYMHAPVARLLKIFLQKGACRFVFEGRECGGHIGPLSSFSLWESSIETLLAEPEETVRQVHMLFAGGVHDKLSAAMVGAMAGTLNKKGVKAGVLMGTAYLFTKEAHLSGAITEDYQQLAKGCDATTVIETGPGHLIRCINTPYIKVFNELRAKILLERTEAANISTTLEAALVGRLRLASKGLKRTDAGELTYTDALERYKEGVFMVGEISTMRSGVITMEQLHHSISAESDAFLQSIELPEGSECKVKKLPSDIAVVGMSMLVPKAQTSDDFWTNVVNSLNVITEIPAERMDWRMIYDKDQKTKDKSVSKWGGFIDDILFDSMKFGIPPHSLKSVSTGQLLLLEAVYNALEDCGYNKEGFDNKHTSIIVGSDGGSIQRSLYDMRALLPLYVDHISDDDFARLPEWNEESLAGTLTNVLAGRVANRFNLGGANFSVDAACASSLTGIDLAVRELESGNSNIVIAAGIDVSQHAVSFVSFSKTHAMSPTGAARPFDKKADGIVLSEGVGVVVLKRLADAERDGDKIYSVIKGTGCSSDGKGLGLTAPRSSGQEIAFQRAYDKAGVSPASLGFYEAHATGTPVGDKVELETIAGILTKGGAQGKTCAIGSVKAILGHTKTCAGIVGLIKSSLSLYYKTLPPHLIKNEPLDLLSTGESPVYTVNEAVPWFGNKDRPRRAGISAFGFGGTNAHVVLEEYGGANASQLMGGKNWPAELFVVVAEGQGALVAKLDKLLEALALNPALHFYDLAYIVSSAAFGDKVSKTRLSIVAGNASELKDAILTVKKSILGSSENRLPANVSLSIDCDLSKKDVSFVFPGQGSQYVHMGREVALYFAEMRDAIEQADQLLTGKFEQPLSRYIYPTAAYTEVAEEIQIADLKNTHRAQSAIGAISVGYFEIFRSMGLSALSVAGHSYGELTALHCAGVIDRKAFFELSEERGRLMSAGNTGDGTMAVVFATQEELAQYSLGTEVVIANYNAPKQVVVSGGKDGITALLEQLKKDGIKGNLLEVSGPFHSPIYASAAAAFEKSVDAAQFAKAKIPVYSNTTAGLYPATVKGAKDVLKKHLLSPVNFVQEILKMYENGTRVFLELGPKKVMKGLISQILGDKEHLVLSAEGESAGMKGFLTTLGALFVNGIELDLSMLFGNRSSSAQTIDDVIKEAKARKLSPTTYYLNGEGIRHPKDPDYRIGKSEKLTMDTRKEINVSAASQNGQHTTANRVAAHDPVLAGFEAYQATMRQFLISQERILTSFLSGNTGEQMPMPDYAVAAGVPEVSVPQVATVEANTTATVTSNGALNGVSNHEVVVDRNYIGEEIVNFLCERTGYPKEMIGYKQDLESDLGIDSIKRVEMLDCILNKLPESRAEELNNAMPKLIRTKTIDGLLDIMFAAGSQQKAIKNGKLNEIEERIIKSEVKPTSTGDGACARFVMKPAKMALRPYSGTITLSGNYIITADEWGVADLIEKRITKDGGSYLRLDTDLQEPEKIKKRVSEYMSMVNESVDVIHLSPISFSKMPDNLPDWRLLTQIQTKSLFNVLSSLSGLIGDEDEFPADKVIAASMFGGMFGRGAMAGPGLVSGGGNSGILNSLKKEWGAVKVCSVDFGPELTIHEIAEHLIDELALNDEFQEVGYCSGERLVFSAVETKLDKGESEPTLKPGADWVVLATGGAKGITAEVVKSILLKGMKVVLVGRSDAVTIDLNEWKQLGADVVYYSADVRSEPEFGKVISDVYSKFGKIDAVFHGAGIIDDQPIVSKSWDSFDKVFDTKVDSGFLLYKYLNPEQLKLMVYFGSVSGRFGNQGQTDYAAANEVLNRFAWLCKKEWPSTRTVVVNWGPWSGTGMASPLVINLLKRQGIVQISPEQGCEFFLNELRNGNPDEVEVVAGDGPWKMQKAQAAKERNLSSD